MRRLILIVSAGCIALCLVSITTLAAGAQTSNGDSETGTLDGSISQGTVTGATQSQLEAIRREMAQEDRLPDYTQVVDNTSSGRFVSPGWNTAGTSDLAHGGSYASSVSAAKDARFKLRVPRSGTYSVYGWWTAKEGNTAKARFGVRTSSGTKWSAVNQTTDGGTWIPIGTYEMNAGDYYAVSISTGAGSGTTVAAAVALVSGATNPPPDDLAPADGGPVGAGVRLKTEDVTYSASALSGRVTGRQLIRQGKTHMGTPYRLSPPAPCIAYEVEDCSCFTSKVFRRFGKRLPDSPITQWKYGHLVRDRSQLKLGDLLFWKENGYSNPITHVGMYAGNGYVLHASSYYHKVVKSKMRYVTGYYGAKRVRPPL
jgi:cell wall-associated NlpC family hydrolase